MPGFKINGEELEDPAESNASRNSSGFKGWTGFTYWLLCGECVVCKSVMRGWKGDNGYRIFL